MIATSLRDILRKNLRRRVLPFFLAGSFIACEPKTPFSPEYTPKDGKVSIYPEEFSEEVSEEGPDSGDELYVPSSGCEEGLILEDRCGINNRGRQRSSCSEGIYVVGECLDPDECKDGTFTSLPCGLNGRGTRSDGCRQGRYLQGICSDSDECVDGTFFDELCGLNGRGIKRGTCIEGSYLTSECLDPDLCVDGSSREVACGLNNRGSQIDLCSEGNYLLGICNDPDICINGSFLASSCGLNDRGIRLDFCARGNYEEGICSDPDECIDGNILEEICGFNHRGTRTQICVNGHYDPGSCSDSDICRDGDIEINEGCNLNGRGWQYRECLAGQWERWNVCVPEEECRDEEWNNQEQTVACGLNNRGRVVQSRTKQCVEGYWTDWGEWTESSLCEDTDECVDGTSREESCGLNGRGRQHFVCVSGTYIEESCFDLDNCRDGTLLLTEFCGGTGTRTTTCITGQPHRGECLCPENYVWNERWCEEICVGGEEGTCTDACSTLRDLASCRELRNCIWDEETRACYDNGTPSCTGDEKFTIAPINEEWPDYIIPLGSTGSRILPSPFLYLRHDGRNPETEVKAPGSLYIIQVESLHHLERVDLVDFYGITFTLCDDLVGRLKHLTSLTPELQALFHPEGCMEEEVPAEGLVERCTSDVHSYHLAAGHIPGTTGSVSLPVLDFSLYDYRTELSYANPDRYPREALSVVCPLDYYPEENQARQQLYNLIPRSGDPLCGEVMQDAPGTLQGNWFFEDGTAERGQEKHLGLLNDHWNASRGVISIGGIIMEKTRWTFTPRSTDFMNRNFSEVTDSQVYCYADDLRSGRSIRERILIELNPSTTDILIEYQIDKTCEEGEFLFIDPKWYRR